MLILSDEIYEKRGVLGKEIDAGRAPTDAAFEELLELDPHDHVSLLTLGRRRRVAGDIAGARAYFWRAIQSHPCVSDPYAALANTYEDDPESSALREGLAGLAVAWRLADDDKLLKEALAGNENADSGLVADMLALPAAQQRHLILQSLRSGRDAEPADVAVQLGPLRLLELLTEEEDLDPATVDEFIAQGEAIAPFLVGVMRDWAQHCMPEADADICVENAVALLGETGSPGDIPHLLEFVGLENENASGPAKWALGRIVHRRPEKSAEIIGALAPAMDITARVTVLDQILRERAFDPEGKLPLRLAEGLDSLPPRDRDDFFPVLITVMAATRGQAGIDAAREVLRRAGSLVSRKTRHDCEDLVESFAVEGCPLERLEPHPATVYEICAGEVDWGEDAGEDEEEEDFDSPTSLPPARRAVKPGRNDPCWCNSGKKYKKCHLASDEAGGGDLSAAPVPGEPEEFVELRKRIGRFLDTALPAREASAVVRQFFGDQKGLDERDANLALSDWLIHDRFSSGLRGTVLEEFLAVHGGSLTPREREVAEAWTKSFVGLYEVQAIEPGTGFTVEDLIFGGTFFIHDVSLSKSVSRWDGLMTRVVPGERGTEATGSPLLVPRSLLPEFRTWLENDHKSEGVVWPKYLKRHWPRIRLRAFALAAGWMDSVKLANSDGEEFILSKAVFRLTDEGSLSKALRGSSDFDEDDSGRFVWLNARRTVLGTVSIDGDSCVLECNSRERLERGTALLLKIAPGLLKHVRDEHTTQRQLKGNAAAGTGRKPDKDEELPREVRNEIVADYLESHYREWPDMKLPALEGETPRQAAATARGRELLRSILKDIENGEDHKRRNGEPAFDVDRLRVELGLQE